MNFFLFPLSMNLPFDIVRRSVGDIMKTLLMALICLNFMSFGQDFSDLTKLDEKRESSLKNNTVENQRLKFDEELINKAQVVIVVNRAPKGSIEGAQTLKMYHNGVLVKDVMISTGRWGKATPVGYFRPIFTNHMRIYQNYFSGAYSGSPMKWAVFFNGGIALHSTTESNYSKLGSRASAGCIRMTMTDAKEVNELIRLTGSANYVMRKWQHAKHQGTHMWNEYFRGSEIEVPAINRYSGELKTWDQKSVDTIIAVIDPR